MRIFPYRRHTFLVALVVLCTLLVGAQHLLAMPSASQQALLDARAEAQAAGSYRLRADMEQTLIPRAIPSMIGTQDERIDMRAEGEVQMPDQAILRMFPEDGSTPPLTMVQYDGQSFVQEGDILVPADATPQALAAPTMDYMGYLDAAEQVQRLEPRRVGNSQIERYSFAINGSLLAEQVRDQMQQQMQGDLPPGMTLSPSPLYQRMTGQGELWVNAAGLPVRQLLDLDIPQVNDEYDALLHIDVTFADFGSVPPLPQPVQGDDGVWRFDQAGSAAVPGSASSDVGTPWQDARPLVHPLNALLQSPTLRAVARALLAALLGMAALLAFLALYRRHQRRVYLAVALSMTLIFLTQPLLQAGSLQRFQASTAHAAEAQQEQQDRQEAARILQETRQNTPHLNQSSTSSSSAAVAACGDGSPDEDSDGDGLSDFEEGCLGTNAYSDDTDNDLISDMVELTSITLGGQEWTTDPLQLDSNYDGLADFAEYPTDQGGTAPSWDPDNDGIPNPWDEDNDGDGVSDSIDLSPFSAASYDTRFSLQTRNEGGFDGYQYIEVQVQPEDPDRLRYSVNALDWPYDDAGQVTDLNDTPDDLNLIPMLEITTSSAPDLDLAENYGVSVSTVGSDTLLYVSLNPVNDHGQITTFQAKVAYDPASIANIQWEARLVWVVQMEQDQWVSGRIQTSSSTIHSYDDSFRVTGFEITKSRDVETALLGTPLSQNEDNDLFRLLLGMNSSFLAGETLEGQTASTMLAELVNRIESPTSNSDTFGVEQQIVTDYATYAHADEMLADMTQVKTPAFLATYGYNVAAQDEQCQDSSGNSFACAAIIFASEQDIGSYNMDNMDVTTPDLSDVQISLDADDFPLITTRSATLNMYEYQSGSWEAIDMERITELLVNRYDFNALAADVQDVFPGIAGEDLFFWTLTYYLYWSTGATDTVAINEVSLLPEVGQAAIDEITNTLDNTFTRAFPTDVTGFIIDVTQAELADVLADSASNLFDSDSVGEAGLNFAAVLAISAVIVIFEGLEEVNNFIGGDNASGVGFYVVGGIYAIYRAQAPITGAIAAYKAYKAGDAIFSLSQVSKASKGAVIIAVVALVLELTLIWGQFGMIVANSTTDYGWKVALAYAVVATVIAIIFFVLSLIPGWWVVVAVLFLVDFIVMLATGGKVRIIETATRAIAEFFYNVEILTQLEGVDFAGSYSGLTDEEAGMIIGNRFYYNDIAETDLKRTSEGSAGDLGDSGGRGYLSGSSDSSAVTVENSNHSETCEYPDPLGSYGQWDPQTRECENAMWVLVDLDEAQRNVEVQIEWEIKYWYRYREEYVGGLFSKKKTETEYIPSEKASSDERKDYRFTIDLDVLPTDIESFWTWDEIDNPDRDADSLADSIEASLGSSTSTADSDGDGRADGWDSDGDGLSDGYEYDHLEDLGTDLLSYDTDNDGLSDRQEIFYNTIINDADSDDDGLLDGEEVFHQNQDGTWSGGWTVSPTSAASFSLQSNPLEANEDGDELDDAAEQSAGFSPYAVNDGPRLEVDISPLSLSPTGQVGLSLAPGEQVDMTVTLTSVGENPIDSTLEVCLPSFLTSISGGSLTRIGNDLIPATQGPSSEACGTRYAWSFSADNMILLRGEIVSTSFTAVADPALGASAAGEIIVSVPYGDATLQETISVVTDADDPTVQISAPQDGDLLTGSSYVVGGTASDATSWVTGVEIVLPDATTFSPAEGTGPWASTWTLPADGEYTLRARSTDYTGRTSAEDTVTVMVDNTAPTISTTLPDGTFVDTLDQASATVDISGSASDNLSGLSRLQIRIDDGTWQSISLPDTFPTSYTWNYTWSLDSDAQGEHSIELRAWDRAGHASEIVERTVIVDAVAPTSALLDSAFNADTPLLVNDTADLDVTGYANDAGNVPEPLSPVELLGDLDAIHDATVWLEIATIADTVGGVSATWLGDVNGDGRSDLAVGLPAMDEGAGRVSIIYGRGGDWPIIPDAEAIIESPTSFIGAVGAGIGAHVTAAGDVNGDGYDDILIGDPVNNRVFLVFGQPGEFGSKQSLSGERVTAWSIITAPDGMEIGTWFGAAGNVNGDLYQDVLIGATPTSGGDGVAYLLAGHSNPWGSLVYPAAEAALTLPLDPAGATVAGVGDVNGDLYDDVAIADPDNHFGGGSGVYLFTGSASYSYQALQARTTSDATHIAGDAGAGDTIAALGDVSGDAVDDVIFSSGSSPRLVLGASNGSYTTLALTGYTFVLDRFVAAAGDVNADGINDFMVGATDTSSSEQHAYLFLGANGINATPAVQATLYGVDTAASAPHVAVADLNCDDSSDLLLVPIEATTDRYLPDGLDYSALPSLAQVDLPGADEDNSTSAADSLPLAPPPAVSGTTAPASWLFVDDDYCDGCDNDGYTWGSTAFASIQAAVDAASSGTQITVRPGAYSSFSLGSGQDDISIIGVDTDAVFVDGGGGSAAVALTDVRGVTISGMTIRNVDVGVSLSSAGTEGYSTPAYAITLDSLLIHSFTSSGIATDRSSVATIQHSTIAGDGAGSQQHLSIDPASAPDSSLVPVWTAEADMTNVPVTSGSIVGENGSVYALTQNATTPYALPFEQFTPGTGWSSLDAAPMDTGSNLSNLAGDGSGTFYVMDTDDSKGVINAIMQSDGKVYIGGDFTHVRNPDGSIVQAHNLAYWDTSSQTWHAVGSGVNGAVHAIGDELDNQNRIYVGGEFSHAVDADGTLGDELNGFAYINANDPGNGLVQIQECSDVIGVGDNGIVYDIYSDQQFVYPNRYYYHTLVGGNFDLTCGSNTYTNFAYYRDNDWINAEQSDLTIDAPVYAVGGGFYDGTRVRIIGIGIGDDLWFYRSTDTSNYNPEWINWDTFDGTIYAISRLIYESYNNYDIYVAGDFDNTSYRSDLNNITRYHVTRQAYTSGHERIQYITRNGALGGGTDGPVYDISDSINIVGNFTTAGGVSADGVASCNTTSCSSRNIDIAGGIALAVDGNYVGGSFDTLTESSTSYETNLAVLSGGVWGPVAAGDEGTIHPHLYQYDTSSSTWYGQVLASPITPAAIVSDGTSVYATESGSTNFHRYSPTDGSHTALAAPGVTPGNGHALAHVGGSIYMLQGGGTGFARYDIAGNSWATLTAAPFSVGAGAALAWDGGSYLYATQGGNTQGFARYSLASATWETLDDTGFNVDTGGGLARVDQTLYAAPRGTVSQFYSYGPVNSYTDKLTLQDVALVVPASAGTPAWLNVSTQEWEDAVVADGGGNQWVSDSGATWSPTPWDTSIDHSAAAFTDEARDVYRTEEGSTLTAGYYDPTARTVYVSPTFCEGCDNGGLTWGETAFTSIQQAIDSGALTVNVRAGIYQETFHLVNGVEVIGSGADTTIIEAPVDATTKAIVTASGVQGARLARLSLVGNGAIDGVLVNGSAQDVSLSRLIIRGTVNAVRQDGASTELELVNTTIVKNENGLVATSCAAVDARNSVFAFHTGTALSYEQAACSNTHLHEYNAYWKNTTNYTIDGSASQSPGLEEVFTDPLFENAPAHTYRPADGSALLGAGNPADPVPPGTGGRVDIGYFQDGRAALYVDDDYCATCDNDGLEWQVDAFDRIQDAIDAAEVEVTTIACGVVIEDESSCYQVSIGVAEGTYSEDLALRSRIKLVGSGAELTTIQSASGGAALTLDNVHHVGVYGFTIADATSGAGVLVDNQSRVISMTHNLIRDNGDGILFQGGSSGEVDFSTIVNHSGAGVIADGADTWVNVRDSILSGNAVGLQATSGGQIFNAYNLLDNTTDYQGDVAQDDTEIVGQSASLDSAYAPTLASPAVDTADPLVEPPAGGGGRADMGYTELAAVPLVLLPGEKGISCAAGNSGIGSVEVGIVAVDDATTPTGDTIPTTWSSASLRTPDDTASYWDASLPAATQEGLHRIYTRQFDEVGNAPEGGASYAGAFVIDTTAPTVVWSAPADGTSTSDAAIELVATVQDYASTGSGKVFDIDQMYFEVNGEQVAAAWSTASWEADPDSETPRTFRAFAPLPEGSSDIVAVAVDAAGNEGRSSTRTVSASGSNVATITSLADGDSVPTETLTLVGYARFDSGSGTPQVQVQVEQGGSTLQTVAATLESPGQTLTAWSAEVELSAGEGSYTLAASAGRGGSFGSAQSISISYDTTAPDLTITAPATDGSTVTQQLTLEGTVDDSGSGIASVEVSFDDGCTWLPASDSSNNLLVSDATPAGSTTASASSALATAMAERLHASWSLAESQEPGIILASSSYLPASFAPIIWSLDWTPNENQENIGYTFLVRVQDQAGNTTIETRKVTVDNTPPTGLDPVTFNIAEESYLDDVGEMLTLTWTKAVDASGVADVLVTVNQDPDGTATGTPTDAANRTHSATLDSSGTWYVHLAAVDALGNRLDRSYGPWYVGEQGSVCTAWAQVIDRDGFLDTASEEWLIADEMLDDDERSGQVQQLYTTWDAEYFYLGWQGALWKLDGALVAYFDIKTGGTTAPLPAFPSSDLPFEADYALVISGRASSEGTLWAFSGGAWQQDTTTAWEFVHDSNDGGGTEVRVPWGTQQVSGGVRLLAAAVTDEGDIWSVFPTTNPLAGPWSDSYYWNDLCTAWPPNSGQPQTKYVTLDISSPQGKRSLWGPGDTIQYAMDITNGEADESLDGLKLELTASEGLTLQSISGVSCPSCTPGATTWVIDLPTLAALGSQTLVIEAVLDATLSVDEVTTGARLLLGSAPLAEGSHTNQADGQPPVVAVNGSLTLQSNTQETISGTASDGAGIGVALVEMSLDGGSTWQPATGTARWSYALTVGQVGTVAVQVRATDLFGNVSDPVAYTFIVDDTGPTVSVALPENVRSQRTVVGGSASDPDPADGEIVRVEVQLESESSAWRAAQAPTRATTGDAYSWRYLWNLPTLDGEVRQLRARSTDAAGNVSAPSGWEQTIVDTVPPVIISDTVVSAIHVAQYTTTASGGAPILSGSVTDGYGVASVTVEVFPPSGGSFEQTALVAGDTWSYTPVLTETVLGRYRLQVTAVDLAGNSSTLGPFALWVQETAVEGLIAFNDGPTALGETTTLSATIATGSNTAYTWALGDGSSATGAEVAHTYAAAGVYTATVTTSNSAGTFAAQTTVIVQEPIAGLTVSNDGPTALGEATTLQASVTAGTAVSYTWELGDGSSATGAAVTHTYAAAGEYVATVTAVNQVSQASAATTVMVTVGEVTSEPPTVYLPMIVRSEPAPQPAQTYPDLVGTISLSPDQRSFAAGEPVSIKVEVTNQGDAATEDGFWIELYINPAGQPAVNQPWDALCGLWPCHGIVWGVRDPLQPGESITLTSEAGSYTDLVTIWPGWFAAGTSDVYLLVDSWNCDANGEQCVAAGAIAERNETNNLTHLGGLTVTGENPPLTTTQAEALPLRPPQPGEDR